MQKVLVALLTAEHLPYLKRISICKETWVPFAPPWATVMTFSGPKLGVPDDYDMQSYRTKTLCKRVLGIPDWEWLLRVDDDVYVNWRGIIIPQNCDYSGPITVQRDGDTDAPYTMGAVTWLSRTAVRTLALDMKPGKGVVEDRHVGQVLQAAGMKPKFREVHQIVKRPGMEEITEMDKIETERWGFALEVNPENMVKLHQLLGYGFIKETPTVSKLKIPVKPPAPTGPSTYRDLQGRTVIRNPATWNDPVQTPLTGGAIARPDTDPGWRR